MSDSTPAAPTPFLALPGFLPDALPFATRSVIALLLAYLIAFTAQVDSASTAGVCVAIVAQPSAGMAMSKAIYRVIGTLLGGCVAMALLAAFPQDRTMLLGGYALWLGVCAFVATLLRDFRSYGAALSGYTVGIIAIGVIDAPNTALTATLDRVAAILIGVVSVLVVNSLMAGTDAFDALVGELRARTEAMTALVADALEGRSVGDDMALMRLAAGLAIIARLFGESCEIRIEAALPYSGRPGPRRRISRRPAKLRDGADRRHRDGLAGRDGNGECIGA